MKQLSDIIASFATDLVAMTWFRVFLVQGVIGILIFEWCYAKLYRHRIMPEEFHRQFPAFWC